MFQDKLYPYFTSQDELEETDIPEGEPEKETPDGESEIPDEGDEQEEGAEI